MNDTGWIGKNLNDRYQIQELLGEGGMSAVYKAYDPNLRRVVAVKLIHPHLSRDPKFVRRFEEEAAAVAKLRHSNIIQVYDFNHDGSTYYIVFEFVPGESLRERMIRLSESGRTMPAEDIINFSASVADALQYAHKLGIIHRDIKPANIMINIHGQAILTDFGIVKIVGGDTHTATGAVMGTARYISPEQVRSEAVDYRTDIYSLGVSIFEMASGEPPYAADSAMTVMMMHINDPVPDVRTFRPDLPTELTLVINKAMAKNPDDRYQEGAELAVALRAVEKSKPGVAAAAAGAAVAASSPPSATVAAPPPGGQQAAAPTASTPPPSSKPGTAGSTAAVGAAGSVAGQNSGGSSNILLFGGLGALILMILCLASAAALYFGGVFGGGDDGTPASEDELSSISLTEEAESQEKTIEAEQSTAESTSTTEPADEDADSQEEEEDPVTEPTLAPAPTEEETISPTDTPIASPTLSPTNPPVPTEAPQPTATQVEAPTEAAGPSVLINSIGLDGESFVVDYTPYGYTPQLPGTHMHFFFSTVPPQNAGVGPTQETWILYGGPNPFTGYRVSDRPSGAAQMCVLVANPDHTIQLRTGNCYDLP